MTVFVAALRVSGPRPARTANQDRYPVQLTSSDFDNLNQNHELVGVPVAVVAENARPLKQTWCESGLGAPDDIDALKQRILHLEQQAVDLHIQLDERDQDLNVARAANRELMTQLNANRPTR